MDKCKKCGNDTFKLTFKAACSDCEYNAAYDEKLGWIVDGNKIDDKGLIRNHAEDYGYCDLLPHAGSGCWIIACTKCGDLDKSISRFED